VSYLPDVLADDGLASINWFGLDDCDLGGYSLGGRIVLRMLVRRARPARAIVAGHQGLDAINRTTSHSGRYHRVLTALTDQNTIEPRSPDEEPAQWITSPAATSGHSVMPWTRTSRHPTPCCAWSPITPADALAATLLNARFTRVPGNHFRGAAKIRTEAAIGRS
jgi:hypothetical protein